MFPPFWELLGRSYRLRRQTADMTFALLHTLATLTDTVALVDQQNTEQALHIPPVTYFYPSQVRQRAKRSVFDNELQMLTSAFSTHSGQNLRNTTG